MASVLRRLVPAAAVAFGLVLGVASVSSAAEDAKGSITGTVVDKEGNPVAGVQVHLMKPPFGRGGPGGPGGPGGGQGGQGGNRPPGGGQGQGQGNRSSIDAPDAIALQQQDRPGAGGGAGPGRGQPPTPVATAETGEDGKFTMKDVPAGQYMIGVRDPEKKLFGRAPVTVTAGQAATVTIKCSDTPPARGPGGPGGGQGGQGGQGGGRRGGQQQQDQ